ncbi:MAG: hypothetical protein V3U78_04015 [Thiotrichaceae bacterium]
MYLSKFKLYLFPENTNESVDQNKLISLLKDIQFINKEDKSEENIDETAKEKKEEASKSPHSRFLTGNNFLSHLCFLGCSPDVEFQPDGDKPYIYVEVPQPTHTPQFTSGINIKIPKCPQCKKVLSTLPATLKKGVAQAECPHCQTTLEINKLNWRKTACFSSTSIIINNIYESEAVPDDLLLDALKQATDCTWKYSYIRFDEPV